MKTEHQILFANARRMKALSDRSVDLVVTSPPYPMIEMWDPLFCTQNPAVKKKLSAGDGPGAFELMHTLLDPVWKEVFRVLKYGGFACVNIGDATRTIRGRFALYANHARMLQSFQKLGFSVLPCILWRKQTNAPNKFMGSGMLPAGAYVTLEHEYILILRKGDKREFLTEAVKKNRRASALFWEERNQWFSDIWMDIKGSVQTLNDKDTRKRSAAFPFHLAYRLINMYSVKGDRVLDPFLGTGTTTLAAMAAGRNSVGYEIDTGLETAFDRARVGIVELSKQVIARRLERHIAFVRQRTADGKPIKHQNIPYGFPVITAQEKELFIDLPDSVRAAGENQYTVSYSSDHLPELTEPAG